MTASTRCSYLSEVHPDFTPIHSPFKGHPWSGRTAMGYGRKIPTDYMIRIGQKLYRVYCCQFSNIGTCYIDTKYHKFLVVLDGDVSSIRPNA
jgi:hypothetical protein